MHKPPVFAVNFLRVLTLDIKIASMVIKIIKVIPTMTECVRIIGRFANPFLAASGSTHASSSMIVTGILFFSPLSNCIRVEALKFGVPLPDILRELPIACGEPDMYIELGWEDNRGAPKLVPQSSAKVS